MRQLLDLISAEKKLASAIEGGDDETLARMMEHRASAFDALVAAHTERLDEIVAKLDYGMRELSDSNWDRAEQMIKAARDDLASIVSSTRIGVRSRSALGKAKRLFSRIGKRQVQIR